MNLNMAKRWKRGVLDRPPPVGYKGHRKKRPGGTFKVLHELGVPQPTRPGGRVIKGAGPSGGLWFLPGYE